MKKLIALMLVFVMLLSMAAVAAADEPVRVYALKGPTGIGMPDLEENTGIKPGFSVKIYLRKI